MHIHSAYPWHCGGEGMTTTNEKQVDCPECLKHKADLIDLFNHPLTPFFRAMCVEYQRGMEKYGPWEKIDEDRQIEAIDNEYEEWSKAANWGDAHGEHGEINELVHLANVAGKRYEQLMREAK